MNRYLAHVAAFILVWVLSALLLVIVIDPYGLSPLPSSATRFNAAKLGRYGNDRLIKAHDVKRVKPRTVILGSSRVKQGIDPSAFAHSAFAPIYNAGVDNGNLAEYARLLRHYTRTLDSLKYVFIELFAINNMAPPPAAPEITSAELLSDQLKIYSLSGIKASLVTIAANVTGLGLRGYTRLDGFYDVGFPDCRECMLQQFPRTVWNEIQFDFDMSERIFPALEDLLALGEAQGIEVYFFISPFHSRTLYPFVLEGTWPTLAAIKHRLAAYGRVHDFLRYNEFTEEAVSPALQFFPDDFHFSPALGRLILRALFDEDRGGLPPNWGTLLTMQTIDRELIAWAQERNNWVRSHTAVADETAQHYLDWIVANDDVPRWLQHRFRPVTEICPVDEGAIAAVLHSVRSAFDALEQVPVDIDLKTLKTKEREAILHAAFESRPNGAGASCADGTPPATLQWRFKRRLQTLVKPRAYSMVATGLPLELCERLNARLHNDTTVPRVPVAVNAWTSLGVHEIPVRLDSLAAVRDWTSGCVRPVDARNGVFFAVDRME